MRAVGARYAVSHPHVRRRRRLTRADGRGVRVAAGDERDGVHRADVVRRFEGVRRGAESRETVERRVAVSAGELGRRRRRHRHVRVSLLFCHISHILRLDPM